MFETQRYASVCLCAGGYISMCGLRLSDRLSSMTGLLDDLFGRPERGSFGFIIQGLKSPACVCRVSGRDLLMDLKHANVWEKWQLQAVATLVQPHQTNCCCVVENLSEWLGIQQHVRSEDFSHRLEKSSLKTSQVLSKHSCWSCYCEGMQTAQLTKTCMKFFYSLLVQVWILPHRLNNS